jgi:REP element-mobilizing transposase RayT
MCTKNREWLFGEILDGKMILNEMGQIVHDEWLKTGELRPYVKLDVFVVMHDHFHGIIILNNSDAVASRRTVASRRAVRQQETRAVRQQETCQSVVYEEFGKPVPGSIPTIIRSFKSAVTKHINEVRQTPGLPVWQRNYYEHIIRNQYALENIRRYIINNPMRMDKKQRC